MADLHQGLHHFDGRQGEDEEEEEEDVVVAEQDTQEEDEVEDGKPDGSEAEHGIDGDACMDRAKVKRSIPAQYSGKKRPRASTSSLCGRGNPKSFWNEEETNSLLTAMEKYSAAIAASRICPPSRLSSNSNVSHAGEYINNLSSDYDSKKPLKWNVFLKHMHAQGFNDKTELQVRKKVQSLTCSFKHLKAWRLNKRSPVYEDLRPSQRKARRLPCHFSPTLYARMEVIFSEISIDDMSQTTKNHGINFNYDSVNDGGNLRIKTLQNQEDKVPILDQSCQGHVKDSNAPKHRFGRETMLLSMKERKVTGIEVGGNNNVEDHHHHDFEDLQEEAEEGDGGRSLGNGTQIDDDSVDDDKKYHAFCFQSQPSNKKVNDRKEEKEENVPEDRMCAMMGRHKRANVDAGQSNIKIVERHIAETEKQLHDFIQAVKMKMQMVKNLMEWRQIRESRKADK